MLGGIKKQHAEDFHKLEKRLITFEESMDFTYKQYESQKKNSENLMKHNSKLESESKELKQKIANLESNMNSLGMEVNDLEQYGRRDCIEISGVPQQPDEDIEKIAITIGKVLGIDVNRKDIQGCYRISPKPNSAIICKFANRKLKESFMKN